MIKYIIKYMIKILRVNGIFLHSQYLYFIVITIEHIITL